MIDDEVKDIEEEDVGEEVTIKTPFNPSDITLSSPPMNLGDLIDMIQARWINFGTNYQRSENLWSPKQQSRLIESILLGLRLPAFYFEEVTKHKWNIIDGLQRCCTIRNFCIDDTLELNNLEFLGNEFEHKKYSQLPFSVQRDIRMTPITVNLLAQGVPTQVKYILFKRLNTGGLSLNPQEIRTAMFQGKVTDLLKRMSQCPEFLKATCNKIPTRRQEDRNFVSRFIAFYLQDYNKYEPTLDQFITKAMDILDKETNDNFITKIESDFAKAMTASFRIFDEDAFRLIRTKTSGPRPPINRALFEVVAVTFARLDDRDIDSLIAHRQFLNDKLRLLADMEDIKNAFSRATGTKQNVILRFSYFTQIVKESLSC